MKHYAIVALILIFLPNILNAQPICNAYLYSGDTIQFRACKLVENIDDQYYQFSMKFQQKYDEALKICPYFAWGYREKSVAYLKSGDFLTWKYLIDKAVKYDTIMNLGYRAWCRFQFFRDYNGAIKDIELLEKFGLPDIGNGINGDYHLLLTKAMCYQALENYSQSNDIYETIKSDDNKMGLFGFFQLGILKLKMHEYDLAKVYFEKQIKVNNIAEAHYYLGQIYKAKNNIQSYNKEKSTALEQYSKKRYLYDPYTHHLNYVSYQTISTQ